MENLLLNKEHMRMAMLNHEATFKEQVYELHRLYQIQKILMRNIRNQKKLDSDDQRPIRTVDYGGIVINRMRAESDGGDDEDCRVNSEVVIEESEIELTLGPTTHHRSGRRRRNPDTDESIETVSLGYQMKKSNNNNNNNNTNNNIVGNVEEELRLKHHPPWFFQVLSMNMT